jgi:hypothetical protein
LLSTASSRPQAKPLPEIEASTTKSKTTYWPNDVPPTKSIRIPERENVSTDVLDLPIRPEDDVEFKIAAYWSLTAKSVPDTVEVAIDDGSGFLASQQYNEKFRRIAAEGGAPRWVNPRTSRYRLKSGVRDEVSLHYVIQKENLAASKIPAKTVDAESLWPRGWKTTKTLDVSSDIPYCEAFLLSMERSEVIGFTLPKGWTLKFADGDIKNFNIKFRDGAQIRDFFPTGQMSCEEFRVMPKGALQERPQLYVWVVPPQGCPGGK